MVIEYIYYMLLTTLPDTNVDDDISEESPGLPSRDIHPQECKASIPLLHLKDGPSLVMMILMLMMSVIMTIKIMI